MQGKPRFRAGLCSGFACTTVLLHYCTTEKMKCSITWYNRVASQPRGVTCCSSTLPFLACSQVPLRIMFSDSYNSFSSCSVVNTAAYPAPFPGPFWDAARCRPCLVFPFVRPLFSFFFLLFFYFFFILRSLSLTGTRGSPSTCKREGWRSSHDFAAARASSQTPLEAPPPSHSPRRVTLAMLAAATAPQYTVPSWDLVW